MPPRTSPEWGADRRAGRQRGVAVRRTTGFTLIELLVVVAIIGVLMSLLLPALNRAKEMGKRSLCQNNLHQWHLGMEQYVDEFEGWYPVRILWGNHDMFRSNQAWEVSMLTTMAKEYVHPENMFCPNMVFGPCNSKTWWTNRGKVKRPVPGGYWSQVSYWLLVGAGNHPSSLLSQYYMLNTNCLYNPASGTCGACSVSSWSIVTFSNGVTLRICSICDRLISTSKALWTATTKA